MIKGLVVKVKKNYSIVLSDGKFYKVKNKGAMEEGAKIIATEEDIIMAKQKKSRGINKYIGIAVAAAILLTMVFTSLNFGNEVYALATVDINPSLELELDKNYKVIKMNALNEDAKALKDLKVKGMDVEDAIEIIVDEAEGKGFIKDDDESYVLVTTVVLDKKVKKQEDENGINKTIQKQIEVKAGNSKVLKKVNIAINSTTKEIYKEITKDDKKKTIKKSIPLGIQVLGNKIDKNDYKSVQDFFEDESNIRLFEENGDIIANAKHKLNKMVNQVIEMKKEGNVDVDLEDLLEEAEKVFNSKDKSAEEIFDDMEDLADEIEDAIEDIEEEKQDKLDDDDDEDDQDDDDDEDDDEDDDDEDDAREEELERQEELREKRKEAEEEARERREEKDDDDEDDKDDDDGQDEDEQDEDDDDDAREKELERQKELEEERKEAEEEAREREEELREDQEDDDEDDQEDDDDEDGQEDDDDEDDNDKDDQDDDDDEDDD